MSMYVILYNWIGKKIQNPLNTEMMKIVNHPDKFELVNWTVFEHGSMVNNLIALMAKWQDMMLHPPPPPL